MLHVLDPLEKESLSALCVFVAAGAGEGAKQPIVSARMLDIGLVTHGPGGGLVPTDAGYEVARRIVEERDGLRHPLFEGEYIDPTDGQRYTYRASYNYGARVAWQADVSEGARYLGSPNGVIVDNRLRGHESHEMVVGLIENSIRHRLQLRPRE